MNTLRRKPTIRKALVLLITALGISFLKDARAEDYVLHLDQMNLSTSEHSWAPSIGGDFTIPSLFDFDPISGEIILVPQTAQLTRISFGVIANYSFEASDLQFAINFDYSLESILLSNVGVEEPGILFSQGNSPVYIVSGVLSAPYVPTTGHHDFSISDQSNLPIGLSLLGDRNAKGEFQINHISVPEPSSSLLLFLAGILIFTSLRRRRNAS